MKKIMFVLGLLTWTAAASAHEIQILCKRGHLNDCAERVSKSFHRVACSPRPVTCRTDALDKNLDVCTVTTTICSEPLPGNFGGYTCFQGKKDQLDAGLSLTWWTGFLHRYVREICVP